MREDGARREGCANEETSPRPIAFSRTSQRRGITSLHSQGASGIREALSGVARFRSSESPIADHSEIPHRQKSARRRPQGSDADSGATLLDAIVEGAGPAKREEGAPSSSSSRRKTPVQQPHYTRSSRVDEGRRT